MTTAASIADAVTLANGVRMPWVGLGVWRVEDGDVVINSVKAALAAGYRSIDTAAIYRNEEGVGRAIAESGIPRDELFITTKVWNADQGYDSTLRAFEASMEKLGLETLDLYLIHWPMPKKGRFKETWKALEKLYKEKRVRAIGVSNFQPAHLDALMADAEVKPMVNQVELHPRLAQRELREYCRRHGIQIEAWSPLGQGQLLEDPTLKEIAQKYGKTTAQVILRWDLQNGVVVIPKSVNADRIASNAQLFDFELSAEDMARIDALDCGGRIGPDPDVLETE
ncbi:aldo/keto reductase [Paenibacillus thermoaerophilus]|uniref:Aldo/keto reductase n=1 Tax=Paenibacillus thermoaerophilus TaxID=1215385 RepID=A0ABW2V232_9BACL|nr:aldo/keto reductase [Paenibacillus thermoaerophilus]TMV14376.1 aldo/keto reductase [Paenibacillus thermoaerophilus]